MVEEQFAVAVVGAPRIGLFLVRQEARDVVVEKQQRGGGAGLARALGHGLGEQGAVAVAARTADQHQHGVGDLR
ncbi:Uncharacterised protein [Bordetella pertussis]|nr:Uncharacterised protein [Bordetella pertussis]